MMTLFFVLLAAFCAYAAAKGGISDVARGRKYVSGTGFCLWRWTDVDSEYILRLHIVKTPWFAVCLHWIKKPDAEPWLHDHPVSFLSLILRGHYVELRKRGDGPLEHNMNYWFNFVRARDTDKHRIIFCRKNTLTLCLMGPKTREWGFHMPHGWLYWKEYYARLKAGEDMRAEKLCGYNEYGRGAFVDPTVRTLVGDFNDATNALTRRHLTAMGDAQYPRKIVDEERALDERPADAFNPDEVTVP